MLPFLQGEHRQQCCIVRLPTYPFDRTRFWPQAPAARGSGHGADGWRYRVTWKPIPDTAAAPRGTWLVVAPDPLGDHPLVAGTSDAMRAHGLRTVELPVGATDRRSLAQRLADVGPVDGVVSLLALDERAEEAHPQLTRGLAATLAGSLLPAGRSEAER